MKVAIHQPHYLPWLRLIDKIDRCDLLVVLDQVQFTRRGWQHRNYIKNADGRHLLTVPLLRGSIRDRIVDKVVDEEQPWRLRHQETLRHAYARAPYWNEFGPPLLALLDVPWKSLAALAIASTTQTLDAFGIGTRWIRASEIGETFGAATDMIAEVCAAVGATSYVSGEGARAYLDEQLLAARGIAVEWQRFEDPHYRQIHERAGFAAGIAAADLLINEGAAALDILRRVRATSS